VEGVSTSTTIQPKSSQSLEGSTRSEKSGLSPQWNLQMILGMDPLSRIQCRDLLLDHVDTLGQYNVEDRARLHRLYDLIVKELRMVVKYVEFHPNYEEPPSHEQQ